MEDQKEMDTDNRKINKVILKMNICGRIGIIGTSFLTQTKPIAEEMSEQDKIAVINRQSNTYLFFQFPCFIVTRLYIHLPFGFH
jgi:hypothetical protein